MCWDFFCGKVHHQFLLVFYVKRINVFNLMWIVKPHLYRPDIQCFMGKFFMSLDGLKTSLFLHSIR